MDTPLTWSLTLQDAEGNSWTWTGVADTAQVQPVPKRKRSNRGLRADITTHCANGHERTDANTYINPSGYRVCMDCRTEQQAERRSKLRP